jgi:hypothetical protein
LPFLAAVSLIWSLVWLVLSIDICEQLVCDPAYVPGELFIPGVKMVTLFSAWGLGAGLGGFSLMGVGLSEWNPLRLGFLSLGDISEWLIS